MNAQILKLKQEISKQIIGHKEMIDALLIALFTEGHILLEGMPGLAKTSAVRALSSALNLAFARIQFTPDLLPSDILGAEIYDVKSGEFKIKHGPLFTNLLLADEINRAPAKVQSALLEVMQERQVTLGDTSFPLDAPFLVLATQNPLEQEGVYKLPEAQLDRFMFKILVTYNSEEEEFEIAKKVANDMLEPIHGVLRKEELQKIKEAIKAVHIDDALTHYIVKLIFATRKSPYLRFGASPRATIDLLKASKARAYLRGHDFVSPIDIALCTKDVLRHRIILNYEAISQKMSCDTIIEKVMQTVDVP